MNLTDWLGDNPWALWLTLAVLLGIAEILSLDLVLIMIAAGALGGALVAVFAPGLWWLQIAVAVGISVGMLVALRPTLMRRVQQMPGYRSSTDKMVGSAGVATAEITGDSGEIKVDGQIWTARVHTPGTVIEKGTEVEVYEIDGAIAVVYPRYGELSSP
ncbi:NfeD family protein [Microlunatus elymi]|uniref:NfeD family protein n=2 Tax=Microlunatus elymi TaxID=2596828 RepID=A0A516Q6T8_9ACTN|nr:NfeD family protein [Microlunatus elymi]